MISPLRNRTIYLADDHELVANGLAGLLRTIPHVIEVQTFGNGRDLFKACNNKQPTHIFLDIEMPVWDGLTTLDQLHRDFPGIPCLMLSMINEKSVIEDCIKRGAKAFLNKDSTTSELEQALREVDEGKLFYSREVLKALSGMITIRTSSDFQLTEPLTEREYEVLKLICDGLSSKEIGVKLFLSSRTVESHKNNIMMKFGVNSTAKLITQSIRNKIIR